GKRPAEHLSGHSGVFPASATILWPARKFAALGSRNQCRKSLLRDRRNRRAPHAHDHWNDPSCACGLVGILARLAAVVMGAEIRPAPASVRPAREVLAWWSSYLLIHPSIPDDKAVRNPSCLAASEPLHSIPDHAGIAVVWGGACMSRGRKWGGSALCLVLLALAPRPADAAGSLEFRLTFRPAVSA